MATVKASPEAQLRLLELADLDAELGRLEHRRRSLPEHAELSQLEQRDRELRDEIAALEAREGDLRREQSKADADVEQVRARIARDRSRLDAGQVSREWVTRWADAAVRRVASRQRGDPDGDRAVAG